MIRLPFPSSALAGHNTGHWSKKSSTVKAARLTAWALTMQAKLPPPPPTGDIRLDVRFFPPNNRGDRANYGNRMKPLFDGIARALKVNDKRFVPVYHYEDAAPPGRVEVEVSW